MTVFCVPEAIPSALSVLVTSPHRITVSTEAVLLLVSPLHRWGFWGTEKGVNLPSVIQRISDEPGLQTHFPWLQSLTSGRDSAAKVEAGTPVRQWLQWSGERRGHLRRWKYVSRTCDGLKIGECAKERKESGRFLPFLIPSSWLMGGAFHWGRRPGEEQVRGS